MKPRSWAISCAASFALLSMVAFAQDRSSPDEGRRAEERRPDERRPDAPFAIDLAGHRVEFTGSWEYTQEWRRNFDLDSTRARNRRVGEHELELEARWRPGERSEVFLQATGLLESRRTQGTEGVTRDRAVERGQSWLKLEKLGGSIWDLQVGRVALIDRRAWWWDDDLDALRVLASGQGWRLDTGLAQEVAGVSSAGNGIAREQRGVLRWFGNFNWSPAPRHALDVFWLHARDHSSRPRLGATATSEDRIDPSDLRALWIGARASGQWRGDYARLSYWADAARLRGHEALTSFTEDDNGVFTAGASTTRRVRGTGLDLGITATAPVRLRPSVTVAYARGSGGRRSATTDANFRQTGLQENKVRLAGVKRVRRYGELLQPELSNLEVNTLGLGVRVMSNSSVELIGHRFRQIVPSEVLSGSRLSSDPVGTSRRIGRELDLVLAMREWRRFEIVLTLSRFLPGAAFAIDNQDAANKVELSAALNF